MNYFKDDDALRSRLKFNSFLYGPDYQSISVQSFDEKDKLSVVFDEFCSVRRGDQIQALRDYRNVLFFLTARDFRNSGRSTGTAFFIDIQLWY